MKFSINAMNFGKIRQAGCTQNQKQISKLELDAVKIAESTWTVTVKDEIFVGVHRVCCGGMKNSIKL